MFSDLVVLASRLVAKEQPFALATVVRRQAASSAQAGDGALITADGAFHGWLGGSCTQPTVIREALKAIADGAPRLIALAPDPQTEKRRGILVFPMTCHSGGSVDIYIEPVRPPARLLVFGVSPVAQALARLGKAMGFSVHVADPAAESAAFPDAERLWTDPDAARAPEEIAVSILAEIVRVRRASAPAGLPVRADREERDPVCGMSVSVAGARHTAEVSGRSWYFCCGGCREKFLAAPGRFTPAAGAGA